MACAGSVRPGDVEGMAHGVLLAAWRPCLALRHGTGHQLTGGGTACSPSTNTSSRRSTFSCQPGASDP